MLIQVLGTVQASRPVGTGTGGAEVVPVARPARRRLLSLLAVHGGRPVPIDRLVEEFWRADPPARARATLHTHVSELRRTLGPDVVRTEGESYRLDLGTHELDVDAFEAGVGEVLTHAAAGAWDRALEHADAVLRLWRGEPYVELPDHPVAVVERVRLTELRRTLRQAHAQGLLGAGRTAAAVAVLERLVLEHPLQEELWEHLMTGRIQLGDHTAALEVYHRAREALTDLGLDAGPALRTLQTTALRRQEELGRPPAELPAFPTPFVGRAEEVAELGARLDSHRLVTVTGVGGVGKTRMAVEVARLRRERFPGGTWVVQLTDVGTGGSVEHAVTRAVGLGGSSDLSTGLRRRLVGPALVVLDNAEHVLPGVRDVTRVLLGCPDVHVLVTSREPVKVEGELVHDLRPMAVPDADAPVDSLVGYDAVRLFVERAQIDPGQQEPGTMAMVAEVCRRVDGIPLAIGLAAAGVRGRGLAGVLRQLQEDLGALGDDAVPASRHGTLDAVVDWSFTTLTGQERTVLRRLAVFRGSFGADAAEAVASGGDVPAEEVLPALARLVEKSLLVRSGLGPVRYQLLEVVRQYADHRLTAAGERQATADRHARWYADLAARMWWGVHDRASRPAGTSASVELGNLREARAHLETRGGAARDVLVLGGEIAHGATLAGALREALAETRRAVADADGWPEWEVDMRNRLAYLLYLLGDREGSLAESDRACELARTLPPSGIAAWTFGHRAGLALHLGSSDRDLVLRLARDGLDMAEASGDRLARIRCRGRLGHTLAWVGRGDEGLAELQAAVEEARRERDLMTEIELTDPLLQALSLTRERRRHGPAAMAGELYERFVAARSPWTAQLPLPSLVRTLLHAGRWTQAQEVARLMGEPDREGESRVAAVLARATISWLVGRCEEAVGILRQLDGEVVGPHWSDRFRPLHAEVAADAGDLDLAASIAEEHLNLTVGDALQSGKLGTVFALVRVQALAAAREPAAAAEHAERARSAVAMGETLLQRFPPLHDGSLAMETPATYLALARAELTRLTGPDPRAWEVARAEADHVRTRLYAGLGRAEALLRRGDVEAARCEADAVRARSEQLGARGLEREAQALLRAQPAGPTGPSPGGPPGPAPGIRER